MNRSTKIGLVLGGSALAFGLYLSRTTETSLRKKVVKVALAERASPNPNKYWNDVLLDPSVKPKEWCGALVLYALHQAKLGLNVHWTIGVGFFNSLHKLAPGELPKIGDVAYFNKNQHEALVVAVHDGMVTLINGNDVGGKIGVADKAITAVDAFYSIKPLIERVLG
jgi:hypothetical protein